MCRILDKINIFFLFAFKIDIDSGSVVIQVFFSCLIFCMQYLVRLFAVIYNTIFAQVVVQKYSSTNGS